METEKAHPTCTVLNFLAAHNEKEMSFKNRYLYKISESTPDEVYLEDFMDQNCPSLVDKAKQLGFENVEYKQHEILLRKNKKFNDIQDLRIDSLSFPEILKFEGISLWQFVTERCYDAYPREIIEIIEYVTELIEKFNPEKLRVLGKLKNPQRAVLELIAEHYKKEISFFNISAPVNTGNQEADNKLFSVEPDYKKLEERERFAVRDYISSVQKYFPESQPSNRVLLLSFPRVWTKNCDGVEIDLYYEAFKAFFKEKQWEPIRVDVPYYFTIQGRRIFERNFNYFSKTREFRSAFTWKGISFFKPLFDFWRNLFVDYLAKECVTAILTSRRILRLLKPKVIFAVYEVGAFARAMIIEAHRMGVPSIGLAHSVILPENPYYGNKNVSHNPDLEQGFYGFVVPTKTLVFWNHDKEVLTKMLYYPEDAVFALGFDWKLLNRNCEALRKHKIEVLKKEWFSGSKKIALILTQLSTLEAVSWIVKKLDPSKYSILVKLHPFDKNEHLYYKTFTENNFEVKVILDYLYESIEMADLIFAPLYSSVVLDCMALEKRFFVYKAFDVGYTLPWEDYVKDISELDDYDEKVSEEDTKKIHSFFRDVGCDRNISIKSFSTKLHRVFDNISVVEAKGADDLSVDMTVSAIIPVYNRQKTIERAIVSVLKQTHPVHEIIIVDDCSTDNTVQIVEELACRDSRVKLICHNTNKGAQAARNTGIRNATGEWIAFLDSDDEWLTEKTEKQLTVALRQGVCAVHSEFLRRNHDATKSTLQKVSPYRGDIYADILTKPGPGFPSLLVKKECLERIGLLDESIISWQEWDTFIRLAKYFEFGFVSEPCFIWHWHEGHTISKDKRKEAEGYYQVVEKHADEIIKYAGTEALMNHYMITLEKLKALTAYEKFQQVKVKLKALIDSENSSIEAQLKRFENCSAEERQSFYDENRNYYEFKERLIELGVPVSDAKKRLVIVGSAHRVGSTWLYNMLKDIGCFDSGTDLIPKKYDEYGTIVLKDPEVFKYLNRLNGRFIFKSHSYPVISEIAKDIKFVTVIRDPRDVIVSNSFYLAHLDPEKGGWDQSFRELSNVGRIKRLIGDGEFILSRLEQWFRSPIAYNVRYEDLKTNPVGVLEAVLRYLELPVDEEQIRRIAAKHSFKSLTGRNPGEDCLESPNRKGIVGDWQNYFNKDCIAAFKKEKAGRWNHLLVEMGYETNLDWHCPVSQIDSGLTNTNFSRTGLSQNRQNKIHSRLKVAILADRAASFTRIQAEGLQRMFEKLNVRTKVFYNGRSAIRQDSNPIKQLSLLKELRDFNLVVVAMNFPVAFVRKHLNDRVIRQYLPDTPIVLYDNKYLGTNSGWARHLKKGSSRHGIIEGGQWGLERYDWYLVGSVASFAPMLPPGPHPYSHVGINLNDGSLFPAQRDFIALIDFERPYLEERKIQIQACEETNTKYIILKGNYSVDEIRKIYRRCSIYFIAHSESFGLPICELQACGSYVFTPYSKWCRSHYIKADVTAAGHGSLSPNFVAYDNDKDKLIRAIQHVKRIYDPRKVVDTFLKFHLQLFYGDINELQKFVNMVESGIIHSRLHSRHPNLEAHVKSLDEFEQAQKTSAQLKEKQNAFA